MQEGFEAQADQKRREGGGEGLAEKAERVSMLHGDHVLKQQDETGQSCTRYMSTSQSENHSLLLHPSPEEIVGSGMDVTRCMILAFPLPSRELRMTDGGCHSLPIPLAAYFLHPWVMLASSQLYPIQQLISLKANIYCKMSCPRAPVFWDAYRNARLYP
eukprot:scaffold164541_cov21-Tisochrysis_lutea.AAC.2